MDIDELLQIMPPPNTPEEVDPRGWAAVEARLGTALPADYKVFIDIYGSGVITRFINVFNPFSSNRFVNLIDQLPVRLGALATVQQFTDRHPEWLPYPFFPAIGGLVPFGGDDNGDCIFWITDGLPDQWRVVVNEARAPKYEEFNCNAVTFIGEVLTKRRICKIFPKQFPHMPPMFEPASTFARTGCGER